MTIHTMPTLMVWVFGLGGLALILVLLFVFQKAMSSSKDRTKYKSEKIVKDYYAEEEGAKKSVDQSAISSHLIKRWREGLKDVDDF